MKDVGGDARAVSPSALLVLTACIVGAALLAAGVTSGRAEAATGHKTLTVYSVATGAQFLNHEDDRARADFQNPFGVDSGKLVNKETGKGPFAGDESVYSFTLYTSANLKKKVGTALYTCNYSFAKNALCTASYNLKDGSLLATGRVLFTSKSFTLAITGGTSKYFAANGEVEMSQVTSEKQRLHFVLLPS